jgi:hypothetical protein
VPGYSQWSIFDPKQWWQDVEEAARLRKDFNLDEDPGLYLLFFFYRGYAIGYTIVVRSIP